MSVPHQTVRVESCRDCLADCGYNVYSQFGEDGLVDAVFDRIGVENEWCFEVGAADGEFYSNTLRLRQQGWSSVLVESSDDQFEKLKHHESDRTHVVHQVASDMDAILSRFDVPANLDLGVIDIDGQDYWLWHDMQAFRPRVMLVEFHWRDGETFVPPRDIAETRQAGPEALSRLADTKGYTEVARTYVNQLFVQKELAECL